MPVERGAAAQHEPVSIASRPKHPEPHGRLRQDELKYLVTIGARPRTIHLLVCLRTRLNARTGDVRDGRKSIASWSNMKERSVTRGLAWLEQHRIIRRGSFRDGARWVHWIRPLAYDEWPDERAKLAPSPNDPPGERAKLAPSTAQSSAPNTTGERANFASGRANSSVLIQRPYPEVLPQCADTPAEGSAEDLAGALADRWRASRTARGRTHFVDGVALRWLHAAVLQALQDGCDAADIRQAVDSRVDEGFADPRELPTWAATFRDDRVALERRREAIAERIRLEAEHDALVERERLERTERQARPDRASAAASGSSVTPPLQLALRGFAESIDSVIASMPLPFLRKDRPNRWRITLTLRPAPDGTPRTKHFDGDSPDEATANALRWRRKHPWEFLPATWADTAGG
jgi:hypothetical protein